MVFSSMSFLFVFFAVTVLGHGLLKSIRAKNIFLLAASLIFYSWASLSFTAILLFDVFVSWSFALLIEAYSGRVRRRLLVICVAILLSVLGAFKYLGFLLENLRLLTGFPKVVPDVVLPLGISFYTFQLISYVVDVYRGEVRAQRRFWMLLLYASLFHQCVAGPIVRYGDVAEALTDRHVTTAQTSRGISRFTVGLAKKAILANSCAVVADAFFSGDVAALAARPAAGLWLSAFAYALQIYLDFSAYSDMAIGMGLMCGFHYRENFDYPYVSISVTEFWRTWHISLSSFFRDYVYIPLGGNRRGKLRQMFNLFVVWLLTGLWHGASWNYIIWGMFFFLLLALEKVIPDHVLSAVPGLIRYAAMLLIICFSWVIFRFEDLRALVTVLAGMLGLGGGAVGGAVVGITFKANWALLLVSALACTPLWHELRLRLKNSRNITAQVVYRVYDVIHPALLLVLSAMVLTGNTYNPFIYGTF